MSISLEIGHAPRHGFRTRSLSVHLENTRALEASVITPGKKDHAHRRSEREDQIIPPIASDVSDGDRPRRFLQRDLPPIGDPAASISHQKDEARGIGKCEHDI